MPKGLMKRPLSSFYFQGWLLVENAVYWDRICYNMVRNLEDQCFALIVVTTALIALFWLELIAY